MSSASKAADDPRTCDYSHAERECDVVMKGGITSGVVYPHAICELARTYTLRNVGGTSAGAIAAAAAAAAELGRESGGFRKLAELPTWVASDENLLHLFQPQPSTKRLFRIFASALGGGVGALARLLLASIVNFPFTTIACATPGTALIVIASRSDDGLLQAVSIIAGAVLVLILVLLGLALRMFCGLAHAVPRNEFGLCSGMTEAAGEPALTPWLDERLNDFAGKPADGSPLTFGELREVRLDLELMTTNLTLRRPYQLPWKNREYFFHPEEFRRLFPETVVDWLENHPDQGPENEHDQREWQLLCRLLEPLRPLPASDDLPVLVATRMSLSFPLLLSAVPLWSRDMSLLRNKSAETEWSKWIRAHPGEWRQLLDARDPGLPQPRPLAERCWFSDGGISSNFPVHFFDTSLPTRPTFAINLRPFHQDYPESDDEIANVYLPDSSGGGRLEWWYRFPDSSGWRQLSAFASSVVRTMQNRVDEAQMRVPGYRDRIAHVSLSETEGGMNLNMPPSVIKRLTDRGRLAAHLLVERFTEPPKTPRSLSWDSHRWTRYRTTLAALSEYLLQLARGYSAPTDPGERSYAELSARGKHDPPSAYRWERVAQRKLGDALTSAALAAAETLSDAATETLDEGAPADWPKLRNVPRD